MHLFDLYIFLFSKYPLQFWRIQSNWLGMGEEN